MADHMSLVCLLSTLLRAVCQPLPSGCEFWCGNVWVLKTDQLIFEEIQGWHTGKNMAEILSRALDRYNLCGKVISCFTFPLTKH